MSERGGLGSQEGALQSTQHAPGRIVDQLLHQLMACPGEESTLRASAPVPVGSLGCVQRVRKSLAEEGQRLQANTTRRLALSLQGQETQNSGNAD